MISAKQALDLVKSADLIALAMQADAIRKQLDPHGIVSYPMSSVAPADATCRTIAFIPGQPPSEQVMLLDEIRRQQENTSAWTAVAPTIHGTAAEYLKVLALSRIYLENIPHIQTSWTIGLKICQIALRCGADDIAAEDEKHRPTVEQLRCLIRDAGFVPRERDALFRTYYLD